jgi:hypothetical protein
MAESPIAIVQELATQFKGKVSEITLYDGNVCSWEHPLDRSWEYLLLAGEPFSKQLRYRHSKRDIKVFANNFFLNANVAGIFAISHLSFNLKNANDSLQKPSDTLTLGGRQYPLFTKPGKLSPNHDELFSKAEFAALIQELNLQARESLHFASDNISVYLYQPSANKARNAVERLIDLAEKITGHPEELDLKILPVQFHPLIPLIKKWAIDDDADRESFVEILPRSVLESLASEVEPYLMPINSYLDSFGRESPPQEATALGRLAECALEIKQYLKTSS